MKLYAIMAMVTTVGIKRTVLVLTIITGLALASMLTYYLYKQWRSK